MRCAWIALVMGVACRAPAARGDEQMPALVAEYDADEDSVRSFWNVSFSEARLQRADELAAEWSARLDALDFDALDQADRIDWLLLQSHLRSEGKRRELTARRNAETAELLPFTDRIVALEEARWHLQPVDFRDSAEQLETLAKDIDAIRKRVEKADAEEKDDEEKEDEGDEDDEEKGPPITPSASLARRAAQRIDGLKEALGSWYAHYDQFAPGFAWWAKVPYDAVTKALDEYRKHLREEIAGLEGEDEDPLVGDPIGRQALLDEIAAEWLAYGPEELLAIGERELAWCEAEMKKAAGEMGLSEDWKAALLRVKEDHVPPGEQDAFVAGLAREAIAFLDEHQLVTIPELCRQTWRLRMIDEDEQRTYPFAAYGGQDMLVAYPTSTMEHEEKLMAMKGNNRHFTRAVVPHELIPGHHLQGYWAQRNARHRRLFGTPFLGEGWALYWEMREWELGWPQGPEDKIGMLFWRMHRAARILVSLRFHLGEMTPEEMVDFLVERVGHEKAGATSEVRRYVSGDYGPLYQAAYMIGGLQLRALHDELVGPAGMSEREFHDAVLEQNSLPIELIRAALTGAPLARDTAPSWRFAGDV